MKQSTSLVLAALVALVLLACESAASIDAPPAATATLAPPTATARPSATDTPAPTSSSTPTRSPSATATARVPARTPTRTATTAARSLPTVALATSTPSAGSVRIGAICRDGTRSTATGSGACSHHGGVASWIYR